MASVDVSQVLSGIKSLIANPPHDRATRLELYESLKDLSTVIEDPHDTIYRVSYSPLDLTFGVVASNLGLFEAFAKSDTPLTVSSLAKSQSCDEVLLGRILRFLASQRMIAEVDEDTFTANNVTRTLSNPGFAAGMRHNFHGLPCLVATPKFLADTKYDNPSDVLHSPFQIAHQTDLPAFVWAVTHAPSEMVQDFQMWMTAVYGSRQTSWLDVFDVAKHVEGTGPEDVIFVDVAGGVGHQCALLKERYKELEGRIILQDLPIVIPQAIPTPGVETQGIDMWQGQPVKGAKIYYMRMIIHDYPDEKAIALLKLTAEAMTVDSVLVIDELVVHNKGAHRNATQFDLTMLSSLASIERTEKQWKALLETAGFEIIEKKEYAHAGESVIVVVPKEMI